MPVETFRGQTVAAALARARDALGPEAQVVRVERTRAGYTLIASDAAPAAAPTRPARPVAQAAVRAAETGPDFRDVLSRRVVQTAPAGAVPDRPGDRPLMVALIGPTGAGKTTTLAKLAGSRHAFAGRTVGLLGLDTHRVGAVEQLCTLGGLAGHRVEIAWSPEDLPRALDRLSGCDTILVDTPGRGPAHAEDTEVVRGLVARLRPHEVHLVLPAGRVWRFAKAALRDYAAFRPTHLLATKIDEGPDDWGLFDLAVAEDLPMRWMTDGQDVPQDVRPAAARVAAARERRAAQRGRVEVA